MADRTGLGPSGATVAANVRRLRGELNLTYAELSRRLEEVGRPIATLGLRRVEDGERRVDADDLLALATVLGVNPNALLLPHDIDDDAHEAVTGVGDVTGEQLWDWAEGWEPLPAQRPEAPAVDPELTGTARGRAMWLQRAAGTGQDFHDRSQPTRVDPDLHAFLREVRRIAHELEGGTWLTVWSSDAYRLTMYPPPEARSGRFDREGEYWDRLRTEVLAILQSPGMQPLVPSILEALEERGSRGDG